MANITTYLEKKLLAHSVGQAAFAPLTSTGTWVGLFTTSPDVGYTPLAKTGTELTSVSFPGYSRQQLASGNWNAPVVNTDLTNSSKIQNRVNVQWTAAGGAWSTPIIAFGIFDSSTNGNLLWFGPVSPGITIADADTITILANNLTLTLA